MTDYSNGADINLLLTYIATRCPAVLSLSSLLSSLTFASRLLRHSTCADQTTQSTFPKILGPFRF